MIENDSRETSKILPSRRHLAIGVAAAAACRWRRHCVQICCASLAKGVGFAASGVGFGANAGPSHRRAGFAALRRRVQSHRRAIPTKIS